MSLVASTESAAQQSAAVPIAAESAPLEPAAVPTAAESAPLEPAAVPTAAESAPLEPAAVPTAAESATQEPETVSTATIAETFRQESESVTEAVSPEASTIAATASTIATTTSATAVSAVPPLPAKPTRPLPTAPIAKAVEQKSFIKLGDDDCHGKAIASKSTTTATATATDKTQQQATDKKQHQHRFFQTAAANGVLLVGAAAAPAVHWEYPLTDISKGCFCGYLPAVGENSPDTTLPQGLVKAQTKAFMRLVTNGIEDLGGWDFPVGPFGQASRGTKWLVDGHCRCPYRYGGTVVKPASPFPPWMIKILEVCMPLCGLHDKSQWPNSCNLNCYSDSSDSLDWHADDEPLFGGLEGNCCIISLSLGDQRRFELRPTAAAAATDSEPCCIHLGNGDLCTMEGRTQRFYQHRVPKGSGGGTRRLRINFTWRWITNHDRHCGL
eukprot:TRINITY_DN10084_c0_g2_i1.p1 TRINITY_DN10084_c0_g2~~TRINITY_DN10084_c0_g2_i1.p1  ORF type:complete len:498 (-),score=126.92 TRINITY_DN10084_c0_g2_i1:156-1478(-)